jgi:hypothetical protein
MRHGWTVFRTLVVLGVGLGGFTRNALGGELADDRLGMQIAPIVLLARSDVQRDLNLEPRQIAACRRAAGALYDRAALLKGRKDAGARAARRAIDEEMTKWLDKILTPEQLGRLEQIDLQWEGASAMLSRPFLDESLNLSDVQKRKVQDCIDAGKALRARQHWSYENNVDQTRKAIAILDLHQQRIWINLLGPTCKFEIAGDSQTAQKQPSAAPRQ